MRVIGLVLCISLVFVSMSFGALTKGEEDYISALVALEKLIEERNVLTETRDAEISIETDTRQTNIDTITNTYKTQIDSKQVEIDAKQTDLDNLISTP